MLRNLGAGFIGGVGGALVTQAVSAAAQVALQAAQLATPTLDRMLGSNLVAQQANAALGQVATQSGFSRSATTGTLIGAGFTSGELGGGGFGGQLVDTAFGYAGANQTQSRLEAALAFAANAEQQQELGLPEDVPAIYYRGQGAAF